MMKKLLMMVLWGKFFSWLKLGLLKQDCSEPNELFLSNTFGLMGAVFGWPSLKDFDFCSVWICEGATYFSVAGLIIDWSGFGDVLTGSACYCFCCCL